MKLVIDINDKDIPKRQDSMDIHIHFIDGEVCECDYPFQKFEKVFEDIKAEIDKLPNRNPSYSHTCDVVDREDVFDIIDSHISGKGIE